MKAATHVRKAKRQRAEHAWAMVACGVLGVCLVVAGVTRIAIDSSPHRPVRSGSVSGSNASAGYTIADDDNIRTGSILIAPRRGEQCHQSLFDNDTGQVWPIGVVACGNALIGSHGDRQSSLQRIQTISNAFRSPW